MMREILQMTGVTKGFVDRSDPVLRDIELTVYKGEILAILGPSGCGKSTLLRQLAGFDSPDTGQVRMDGSEITQPHPSRVMIFQDFNQLFPWKTVLENLCYPLQINGIGQTITQRSQIAKSYLRQVELTGVENSYPYQLSGGMKQKAAIARALALEPKVLLMDEPFGSLDALTRSSLQQLLLKVWQDTGVTIVFVTHDIQEAILLADRIAVMGRQSGGFKQVLENRLPRPRQLGEQGFSALYEQIYGLLDVYA